MLLFVKDLVQLFEERAGMEESNTQDKRQFRRMIHSKPVRYQFKDPSRFGGCVSKDLSGGGVRILLNDFVPLNAELSLKIRLADESIVESIGRVVWVEKSRFQETYQVGLDFSQDELSSINQKKIYGFLSRQ
ncbi:PilZ domain-containing protein [Patescibacteria group bacterium]|nr:PilZ domain-containing protein [Patescibacteria group bacterium]